MNVRTFFAALSVGAPALALAAPVCSWQTPPNWTRGTGTAPVIATASEGASARPLRGLLVMRDLASTSLDAAAASAKAEETRALGNRPGFELVRDRALYDPAVKGHLFVWRYQIAGTQKFALHYHAVVQVGARVVHVTADDPATSIDALHTPYREAGVHEAQIITAIQSTRCEVAR